MSSRPVSATSSRKLAPLAVTRNFPVPVEFISPPVTRIPFCITTLLSARISPAELSTPISRFRVAPLRASMTLLLMTADSLRVMVPPVTSAEISPLLTSVCVPPRLICCPMVPFSPRRVMPAPMVVVPLPSRSNRLPGPVSPSTTVPLPSNRLSPSKLRMPFLLISMVPSRVRPLIMRSRVLRLVDMSSRPVSATASRKLAPLEVTTNFPVPVEFISPPVTRIPFCITTLLSARISPVELSTPICRFRVPPLRASRTALLITAESLSVIVPPLTSAEISPLFTKVCVPLRLICCPIVPFSPRRVMSAPMVVVPLPSRSNRLPNPVSPNTTVPLPSNRLSPSKLRMPFLLISISPLTVMPLTTRSRLLRVVAISSTPFSVTPRRKLLPVDAARKLPLPLEFNSPPTTFTPLSAMTPSASASSVLPVVASVPPFRLSVPALLPPACQVPPLVPPVVIVSDEPPLTTSSALALVVSERIVSLRESCVMVLTPVTVVMETSSAADGSDGLELQRLASPHRPLTSLIQLTGAACATCEATNMVERAKARRKAVKRLLLEKTVLLM